MSATARPVSGELPSSNDQSVPDADHRFELVLWLHDDYMQIADFAIDGVSPVAIDEPPPLGKDRGPNPARLLGAAIGGCLGASLLFCLRRARVDVTDLRTVVEGTMVRNEAGRLRIGEIKVRLAPEIAEADVPRMTRCLEVFEDYCVVTQSVREGLEVSVQVAPTPRGTR
jgi:uncharacterized OsmC-like protein